MSSANSSIKVIYDQENKIWKSINYPFKDVCNNSVAEVFLDTMRNKVDKNKILDYFYDRDVSKTAQQIYEQSITVAENLKRLGVQKGDTVLLFSKNNEWCSVLTMGALLIGAMVNFFEVLLEPQHVDLVFRQLQPAAIFYESEYKLKVNGSLERLQLKSLKCLLSIDSAEDLSIQKQLLKSLPHTFDYGKFQAAKVKNPSTEVALLVLTSGSTGVPKVVQLSHSLMLHGLHVWWCNTDNEYPLDENSVVFSFSPLRWVSQAAVMLQSLLFGIRRASCCGKTNGQYSKQVLRKIQGTHLFVAPSIMYDALLAADETDADCFQSIRMLQCGGEPCSQALLDLASVHLRNGNLFYCYGMTEVSTCITNDKQINGGKPINGYELIVLDDKMQRVGPNVKGQLALKSPLPYIGYKDLDNSKYYVEGNFFINGDYCYFDDDNNLHVLGRYKDLVKTQKATLIPQIIESPIIDLAEVYVARLAGYRHSPTDEFENGALFVVLNANVTVDADEMRHKIRNVWKSKMSEDEANAIQVIYFVQSVPLTTCGKIDRVVLRQQALEMS